MTSFDIRACISWVLTVAACSFLSAASPSSGAEESEQVPDDYRTLKDIEQEFPGAVRVNTKTRTVEFCPDNTCDAFVAARSVPPEEMSDFAYLFVYYFSEYFGLAEWRDRPETADMARRILSGRRSTQCRKEVEREMARCTLRRMAMGGRIGLFFVRYDERGRHVKRLKLP
jgi:hypothetical protein